MKVLPNLLLLGLLLSGCSHTEKYSGDFAPFLVQRVTEFGGRIKPAQTIPKVDASWTYEHDGMGFQIQIQGNRFTEIDSLMKQLFGQPQVSTDQNLNGQPSRIYSARDIGVAIHCLGQTNGVYIVCLKGI